MQKSDDKRSDGDRPFAGKGHADKTDALIGERIRTMRNRLGWSQAKLGEAVKLTFQQIQKYERGINRVSASTLIDIAESFGIDINYFYDGLTEQPSLLGGGGQKNYETGVFTPEDRILVDLFHCIEIPSHRKQLLDLAHTFAASSPTAKNKARSGK